MSSPEPRAADVKISVIVAVYNPGEYIDELIASLRNQTLPRESYEAIFVDDDSTDGTGERLAALSAQESNFFYLHNTPNSGWPGRPRNLGIDAARGTYVLFVDNDDWLPADALANLWDYATANNSDVVMAKEVGHGHTIPWSAFARNVPRAKLGRDPLLRILTPHKLFRRALLDTHHIRFPEGKVRLEDHLFVMQAYFAADVISIYADNPCYHWVHRDKANASLRPVDPRDYYRDVDRILQVVEDNTEPGALRNTLYHQWYRAKMLQRVSGSGFLRASEERRASLVREIQRITLARFDDSMDDALSFADRTRAALLRTGRVDLLTRLAELEAGMTTTVSVDRLSGQDGCIELAVSVRPVLRDGTPFLFEEVDGQAIRQLPAQLADVLSVRLRDLTAERARATLSVLARDRRSNELVNITVSRKFGTEPVGDQLTLVGSAVARFEPPRDADGRLVTGVVDLITRYTYAGWGSERRIPWPENAPAGGVSTTLDERTVTAYPTTGPGNLSIKITRTDEPALPSASVARPRPSAATPKTPSARSRTTTPLRRLVHRVRRRARSLRRRGARP